MTDFGRLLAALASHQVEFVIIGGLAVITHGHVRATADVDVCYARSPENHRRLVAALAPLHPRLRGAPPELPFVWDERTLKNGLNFTLTTDLGDIDLLGEVTGVGGYANLALSAEELDLYGQRLRLIDLDTLITAKAATGRAKDLLDLEALRQLRQHKPQ
jgi:predicted nucleotidyltransferase